MTKEVETNMQETMRRGQVNVSHRVISKGHNHVETESYTLIVDLINCE